MIHLLSQCHLGFAKIYIAAYEIYGLLRPRVDDMLITALVNL